MSNLLYKIINPPIKFLLKSPLHSIMSGNTLLLEFTGRKSNRALSTPISYYQQDGQLHCFTSKSSAWWRNLKGNRPVHVTVQGNRFETTATIQTEDHKSMEVALKNMLEAVPRDASHAGVRLENGEPNRSDISKAIPGMVYLAFDLRESAA